MPQLKCEVIILLLEYAKFFGIRQSTRNCEECGMLKLISVIYFRRKGNVFIRKCLSIKTLCISIRT